MGYPRLSAEQRRKLANSARAKEAGRNAALRVGVMGGAGPGQGETAETAPYYELPAETRQAFERTIEDTRSTDTVVADAARRALQGALEEVKGKQTLDNAFLGNHYSQNLEVDFAGLGVRAGFEPADDSYVCATGPTAGNATMTEKINWNYDASTEGYHYNVDTLTAVNADSTEVGNGFWTVEESSGGRMHHFEFHFCSPIICGADANGNNVKVAGGYCSTSGGSALFMPSDERYYMSSYEFWDEFHQQQFGESAKTYIPKPCRDEMNGNLDGSVWVGAYSSFSIGRQNADGSITCGLTPLPNDGSNYNETPGTYDLTEVHKHEDGDDGKDLVCDKACIEEIVRILCEKYGICPDPCDPVGGGSDPIGDGPGWDPPGYGGPIGGGYDPWEPGEPGGYYDPGPGDGHGTYDPGRETCINFKDPPAGFNDPTQPGGIARRYQPGQRATMRSGGTDRAADAVERGDTSPDCWDGLYAAGWRGRTNDPIDRLYPPYDFARKSQVSDQVWNCLLLLGWETREAETDVSVVREQALYRPGAPDVYTGKIKRVKRLEGGGVRICFHSPIQDKPIDEKICFRGKVVDAISDVLSRMGVEDVIIDSECNKVVFPRVCFPPGTPLKSILQHFLDICGFCVFPQFDGKVLVGFCEPLNVHWHYHEDVDLIGFDLEYGNDEIPAIVEVFRPDDVNRAGHIKKDGEGYSYSYPVQSAVAASEDVLRVEVPLGTTNEQVRSIAHSRARALANQSLPLTGFAVPLNSNLKLRHQVHIHRPSLGFKGVYMVTRLARDYDDKAFLNLGMGRWLRGSGG